MPIDLEHGAFEPEATAAMGEAFEAACKELCDLGQLQMVRKVVAKRIIAAARTGELDPVRLRTAALSWIINVARSLAVSDYKPQTPKAPSAPAGSPLIR